MRADILPLTVAAAGLFGGCSRPPQAPASRPVNVVATRPAALPEGASAPAPSADSSFETCPQSYTTSVEVGEADVFWWCQNGVIGHRALATAVQETVTQLAGGGWLALDGEHLYVSQAVATGKATLFRMPRTGGPIVKLGPVPAGVLVPDGNHVWIGVENDGVQSFTGGLYRVATSGGAPQLVGPPGNVVAVTKTKSTILFLQVDAKNPERVDLWSVDANSLATKHLTRVGPRYTLHAGAGSAYVEGLRIDLNSGKFVPVAFAAIAVTDTRLLVRCDKTVCVGAHGNATLTPVAGVPAQWQPMFAGPRDLCWIAGKLGDKVQCVPY